MTVAIANITVDATQGRVPNRDRASTTSDNSTGFDKALARQRSAQASNDNVPQADRTVDKPAHDRDKASDDSKNGQASGTAPAEPSTAKNKPSSDTGKTRKADASSDTGAESGAEPGVKIAQTGTGAAHSAHAVTTASGKLVEAATIGAASAAAVTTDKKVATKAALPATISKSATAAGKQGTDAVFIAQQLQGRTATKQGAASTAAAAHDGTMPHGARDPLHAGTHAKKHQATPAGQASRAAQAVAALAATAGDNETAHMARQASTAAKTPVPGTWAPTAADHQGFSIAPQTPLAQQALAASGPMPTSAPALTAQLHASFGSEGWNQALQQQSLRLTRMGGGRAELTLHPRELGQIQVTLKMGDQTHLHFVSPNAHVRAAVEAALPQLRHAFAQSGINLGQASVGDQGQQHYGSGQQGQGQRGRTAAPGLAEVTEPTALTITRISGRTAAGGVDIFA